MTMFRWYLVGLLALFGSYVAVEYYRPKPLDWSPTYLNKDKIPYGTYVLYQVLPEVFGQRVQQVRLPVYNQLGEDSAQTTLRTPKHNYLFINQSFTISKPDTRALLRYVARGNDVFIAAEQFNSHFRDTLGFHTAPFLSRHKQHQARTAADLLTDSVTLRLLNPQLAHAAGSRFRYPVLNVTSRLLLDSLTRGTLLATDEQGRAVLVRIPHGRGNFYLSSVPAAFTNYFVLQPHTEGFAFAALSYLPARPIWWDEYQKQGRPGEQSLLRVLLEHDALRAAYYLGSVGLMLFLLFEAKRRQRIIPILRPLPNTTLLFASTVASLYRQGSNHALIAEKKISLFQEYLRSRFQEPTLDLNDELLRERIAQKAGMPRARIDALVRTINFSLTAPSVSDRDLLLLSKTLNEFRKEAK
ncbi:DUF4350 domain-containing protein [Hymenobacter jejuensis]|uniref:DUF4350 domain-containing protein n=1 Tax=Hymenobacter jejuensis TaxID=2502781 RepID=A0A5B8A172_9BACT|nr:DUF4350 domain-containing protein [Hymenobacter jejuensis]QDA61134.1 DUF4350 domain-containing protein [Hymenobacter jejuensis]